MCATQRSLDWQAGRVVESDRPSLLVLGITFDLVGWFFYCLLVDKLLKAELVRFTISRR